MFKFCFGLFLTVFSFLLTPNSVSAQSEVHDAGVLFASEFCKCMAPQLKHLDKDVIKILIGLPSDESEAEAYLAGLEPEEIEKFTTEMEKVAAIAESPEMTQCTENIEKKMEKFKDKIDAYYEDPKFMEAVMTELEGSSKCQVVYAFFKIALAAGDDSGE